RGEGSTTARRPATPTCPRFSFCPRPRVTLIVRRSALEPCLDLRDVCRLKSDFGWHHHSTGSRLVDVARDRSLCRVGRTRIDVRLAVAQLEGCKLTPGCWSPER